MSVRWPILPLRSGTKEPDEGEDEDEYEDVELQVMRELRA